MAQAVQPYNVALAITKSDTVNFPIGVNNGFCDAIYVGGAGIVVAIMEDGSAVSFTCVAGQVLSVKAKRVNSTTTSATLMVALYYV
jgi:hypothetical protein